MSLTIVTLHQSKYIILRCWTPLWIIILDSGNIATRVRTKNEKVRKTNQSLSVPLAQQSVNGTQQSLLGSPAQQFLIETHRSVDLGTPIDITDDTSSTLVCTLDQDINDIGNSSVTSEWQSIDINSINLNNHVSNDCDSPSIEIHNISMSNTTLNNHLDSDNIATRVKARNEKARKKAVHKKSQQFKARILTNTSSPESLSYEY